MKVVNKFDTLTSCCCCLLLVVVVVVLPEEVMTFPFTDQSIVVAVWLWCDYRAQAIGIYGPINKWNTSEVTNVSELFLYQGGFNDDISEWDVSNVTNMRNMFERASSFNQDISKWDVSKVRDMTCMFEGASSFNQDISKWNVSKVFNMSCMFQEASSFNQDLSGWNISEVTYVRHIFDDSTICENLRKKLKVSSFFEGKYLHMPAEQRKEEFSIVFHWKRRRAFVLFLMHQGYLRCSLSGSKGNLPCADRDDEEMPCDILFNVEDLSRYICLFL